MILTRKIAIIAHHKQLEPKKNYKEKRTTERQMFKKVVHKIQDQNDSNCVNRLYGADISLRGWDLERKRKSFETVEDAQKCSAEMQNLKVAQKKRKNITQAIFLLIISKNLNLNHMHLLRTVKQRSFGNM